MTTLQENPRKAKILIVDDHAIVRQGVMLLTNREPDLEVCYEASNGEEALAVLRTQEVALAIVDISLVGISGIELIKQISARYPRVPVLVMTMHDESLYWDRALRAGARGYVMKQEATEKVLQAIRKVLSGGVYVSDKMQEIMLQRYLMSGGQEPISFIDNLSDREFEILGLIGQGLSTVEIAAKLKRSVKTIEAHRASLKEKLGLKSAQDLTRFAAQWAQRKGQTADD